MKRNCGGRRVACELPNAAGTGVLYSAALARVDFIALSGWRRKATAVLEAN